MLNRILAAFCLFAVIVLSSCKTDYMSKGHLARVSKGDAFKGYDEEDTELASMTYLTKKLSPSYPVKVLESITLDKVKRPGKVYKVLIYENTYSIKNWIGFDGGFTFPIIITAGRFKDLGFIVVAFEDDKMIYCGELEDFMRHSNDLYNEIGAEVVEFVNKEYLN